MLCFFIHFSQAIKSASQTSDLNLKYLRYLSKDIIHHASTMTHLTRLDLDSTSGLSAEGVKRFYGLSRLETLNFNHTNVLDDALEGIGSLTRLKHLYLWETKVTDAGLPHLADLSSLKALSLGKCDGVTDAGMVQVGRLTEHESLVLSDTAVTDDGLQQLTALTKLTELWPAEGRDLKNDDVHRRIGR
ncbi:unnamed protein product [Closterium sp. NIES-53]